MIDWAYKVIDLYTDEWQQDWLSQSKALGIVDTMCFRNKITEPVSVTSTCVSHLPCATNHHLLKRLNAEARSVLAITITTAAAAAAITTTATAATSIILIC